MVSLAEESHSKDGNNKDINDEADEEVNSSLDEEIHVGLPDLALVVGVDTPERCAAFHSPDTRARASL